MGRPMLNSSVLVLNRGYFPVHVTSVRRAFCLLYSGLAKAINDQYETFDYPSWSALSVVAGDEAVGLVGRAVRVPRVVVLVAYDRVPRRNVRFSRRNIFKRDHYTCQYCGAQPGSEELTLDHVLPRAQGGVSSWDNCVLACLACNKRKADRTPEQAKIKAVLEDTRIAAVCSQMPTVEILKANPYDTGVLMAMAAVMVSA